MRGLPPTSPESSPHAIALHRRENIKLLFLCCLLAAFFSASRAIAADVALSGLIGRFNDGHTSVEMTCPSPDFSLTESQSIDSRLPSSFTANWSGIIRIDKQEPYTFDLEQSGCVATAAIDGKTLGQEPIDLSVGEHAIELHCQRGQGAARLRFMWSAPDFPAEPVPVGVLAHRGTPHEIEHQQMIDQGRLLVESLNCIACHRSPNNQLQGRVGPDLSSVGNRLRPQWIAQWLADPQTFRHGALMPSLPLTSSERADIVAYLATLKDPNNKIHEQTTKPVAHIEAGHQLFDTIGCAACHAKLDALPSQMVGIELRGLGSKWFAGQLAAFLENPLTIDHTGRMPSLLLNSDEARNIAEYLTESKDAHYEKPLPKSVDIARGKALVNAAGCIRCHSGIAKETPATAEATQPLADLLSLHDGSGCLAAKPSGGAMRYALAARQRESIIAFIDSLRQSPMVSDAPIEDFYHRVATLGCANCHELNGIKPDVADRIPSLTGVGAKLLPQWMEEVLVNKQRVRPWLHRRMPDFGADHVRDVPKLAMALAGVGPAASLPMPSHKEIVAGQTLLGIGQGGLGCITCHGFNGNKPTVPDDTRGPDLSTAVMRLRPDHFRRWVHDPKRVDPSTPMPSFFDAMPLAEASAKIDIIMRYCALGTSMPAPMGWIDTNNYAVVVKDRARIIRAVLPKPNSGLTNCPRGIAVGLPELISYCFDADSSMLRYVWNGAFVDMRPAWTARGGQEVHVMGKMFWITNVFPLRFAESADQPKADFEGYEIGQQGVPTMLYRLGKVQVKEKITALPQDIGFVREFEIGPHEQPMEFVTSVKSNMAIHSNSGQFQPTTLPGAKGQKDFPGELLALPASTESMKFAVTYELQENK